MQPRRTVRIALWSGEEQGLLGSRHYVMKHFGTLGDGSIEAFRFANFNAGTPPKLTSSRTTRSSAPTSTSTTARAKSAASTYRATRPCARSSASGSTPFRDLGASTLSIANTGGTDHLSFDAVGLPGFQFIQDEIEYATRTHHSNQDIFDRIQADDMKQAAIIMAAFVYNTAARDEKLPRKPAPAQ